eukprot:1472953-Rhodomonas_salina.1
MRVLCHVRYATPGCYAISGSSVASAARLRYYACAMQCLAVTCTASAISSYALAMQCPVLNLAFLRGVRYCPTLLLCAVRY